MQRPSPLAIGEVSDLVPFPSYIEALETRIAELQNRVTELEMQLKLVRCTALLPLLGRLTIRAATGQQSCQSSFQQRLEYQLHYPQRLRRQSAGLRRSATGLPSATSSSRDLGEDLPTIRGVRP